MLRTLMRSLAVRGSRELGSRKRGGKEILFKDG